MPARQANLITLALVGAALVLGACGNAQPARSGTALLSGAPVLQGLAAGPKVPHKRGHLPGELVTRVLPESQDAFFLQALRDAKTSIRMQVYLLTHPGVMSELIAAKGRGIDVQVMLEQNPYNPGNPNNPLPTNRVAAKKLAAGGVISKWTSPTFRYTHAKSLTIDDAVTYVSTANFTKSGLGVAGKGAREYIIEDRSPSDVAEFVAMFKADWAYQAYVPQDEDLVVSPNNARERIFALIRSAKKDLTIQVEVAGDPALDALIAEKIQAGVAVKALLADLPALKSMDLEGKGTTVRGNQETAQAWKAAGAQVRYQGEPHLHAKAIVADGLTAYVGSVNMTTNSMDNNRELGLIIAPPLGRDVSPVVNAVREAFVSDWAAGHPVPDAPPGKRKRTDVGINLEFPGLPL